VAPEGYGIIEQVPDTKARRSLILVSKILQNLANQVEFGSKEDYMCIMNSFITGNMVAMTTFVDQLANPPPPTKKAKIQPSKDLISGSLNSLYSQLMFYKEKIFKLWEADPSKTFLAKKLEAALRKFPHKNKRKKIVEVTVQHEVALKAVHKELKQRVEDAARARAALANRPARALSSLTLQPSKSIPTPSSPLSRSPSFVSVTPSTLSPPLAFTLPTSSLSPSRSPPTPSVDLTAVLIETVVGLRATLEEERKKARELEEKVIEEEKKIEKEAEAMFQKEYRAKVLEFKETLETIKSYKEQLLVRPDLAAEFKSLRLVP